MAMCVKCNVEEAFDASGMCFECSLVTCSRCGRYKPEEAQLCASCLSDWEPDWEPEEMCVEEEDVLDVLDVETCGVCEMEDALDRVDRCLNCYAYDHPCPNEPHSEMLPMCATCMRRWWSSLRGHAEETETCDVCREQAAIDGLDMCVDCSEVTCSSCRGPKASHSQLCSSCMKRWT